jgi:hypothetical protein
VSISRLCAGSTTAVATTAITTAAAATTTAAEPPSTALGLLLLENLDDVDGNAVKLQRNVSKTELL